MRWLVIVGVVAVGGCSTPEQQAERALIEQNAWRARQYRLATPEGQADENCKAKVQFAMASYQARTFLDLEGMARANQMHASCLDYWRRTGQMP